MKMSTAQTAIQPLVAGVQANSDPLHLTEVYFGKSSLETVSQMLSDLGVEIYPEDKFTIFPEPDLKLGSRITINRAAPVKIDDGGKVKLYRTWQKDVQGLLAENQLELLGKDTVTPALDSPLKQDMLVTITRVAEVEVTEKEAINFKISQKQSADLEKGQTKIETKGVAGQKENLFLVKRVNGVQVSKTLKSSKVIKEPVTQVVIIGIGPKLAKSGPYLDTINAAAKKYLINGTALMCLMMRESNGHNTSGYPNGPYQGLFQYDPYWWATASRQAGYAGAAITDPTAQIFTTAYQLTHGQSRRWPPWGGCAGK